MEAETSSDATAGEVTPCALFLPDGRVFTYNCQRVGKRVDVFDLAIVPCEEFWRLQEQAARYASPTERGH